MGPRRPAQSHSEVRINLPNIEPRSYAEKPRCGEYRNSRDDKPHHWIVTAKILDSRGLDSGLVSVLPIKRNPTKPERSDAWSLELSGADDWWESGAILLGPYWALMPNEMVSADALHVLRAPDARNQLALFMAQLKADWIPWLGHVQALRPGMAWEQDSGTVNLPP